jgi:hypothetical protein
LEGGVKAHHHFPTGSFSRDVRVSLRFDGQVFSFGQRVVDFVDRLTYLFQMLSDLGAK